MRCLWPWLSIWLLCSAVAPVAGWAASHNAFHDAHYHMNATYNVAKRTIHGQVSFTAVWQGDTPLAALYFFLPPNTLQRRDPREPPALSDLRYPTGFDAARLTIHHVTNAAGQELSFALQDDAAVPLGRVPDDALLHIPLARPYRAGERVAVDMTFTTRVPRAKNWGVYRGTLALDGLWYPMLVPHRHGTWVWGMQVFVHARYSVRLTTDAAQQVVASVPWTARDRQHGQQTLSGSAGPFYHLGLSSSSRWHRESAVAQTPQLHILAPPNDQTDAVHLLRILRAVLRVYEQQFGLVLPSSTFTVVLHERDLSWPLSAAADNLLFLSRDVVRVPALLRKLAEYFVARGVARQWWGLRTAYNLNIDRWIGEGLASYLALRWLDQQYGRGRNFLTWEGTWLPNLSYREQAIEVPYRGVVVNNIDQPMTAPLQTTSNRDGLRFVYEKKGALVYSMLHDLLGAEAFRGFLHLLRPEGHGTVITSADVHHAAEAASGQDLAWFFDQWVHRHAHVDYMVGHVDVAPETAPTGQTMYVNRVEIRRVGDAVMPYTVRFLATDGARHEIQVAGTAASETITWRHTAPLSDVHIDPDQRLPDVQRLNNTSRVRYTVRPLIDFPRLDGYLLYPFVTMENNFIDGTMPRVHLFALYLDDQLASVSVGYKEVPQEASIEGQFLRNRFPHPNMASSVIMTDRMSARTVTLQTQLTLKESHQQHRIPANLFTLGYRLSFLDRLDVFNGRAVPDDFAPSTGRMHSAVFTYTRDTRVPAAVGAPLEVFAEPLAYGYALRLEAEIASEYLGSTRPDFQQVRLQGSEYLRLLNQTWLQLRLFGGWSAGTIPLQHKLTLAGIDTVRSYPYRLRFLGDRLLGGTVGLRLPVLRDIRVEFPGRSMSLRTLHIAPFVDGGWVWDRNQNLSDVTMRAGAGLRIITGFAFVSMLHFEVAVDIAHPLDKQGRDEDEGVQVWIRFQTTVKSVLN